MWCGSAGLDGKAKVWDVYNERHVKRTYSGHSAAIRCTNFNNDGTRYTPTSHFPFCLNVKGPVVCQKVKCERRTHTGD